MNSYLAIFFFIALLCEAALSVPQTPTQEEGSANIGNDADAVSGVLSFSYWISEEAKTWNAAFEDCRSQDGQLVAPWSINTNRKLQEEISNYDLGPTTAVWTDGKYDSASSSWVWVARGNRKFVYENWLSGQPGYSCSVDCMAVVGSGTGYGWEKRRCNTSLYYACAIQD